MGLAERASLSLGLLILAGYSVSILHRTVGSAAAVREFESIPAASPAASGLAVAKAGVWSESRIRAFQAGLMQAGGKPIAVLRIGKLELEAPVFVGTSEPDLNRGLGWIEGTARPGAGGNSGIAGHRDGFFRVLKDISIGDAVELHLPGTRLLYRVDGTEIVDPTDVRALRDRGSPTLTLVTCFPFYFVGDAPKRFVVHAKLEKPVGTNMGVK